jgi:hypothetical protein
VILCTFGIGEKGQAIGKSAKWIDESGFLGKNDTIWIHLKGCTRLSLFGYAIGIILNDGSKQSTKLDGASAPANLKVRRGAAPGR